MSNTRSWLVVAGTFDLFHQGHIEILQWASQVGQVCALVNTDRFVESFKGKRPVQSQDARRAIVGACRYVSMVDLNDKADLTETLGAMSFICYSHPSEGLMGVGFGSLMGIVFGSDYDIAEYREQTKITEAWQHRHRVALIQYPRVTQVSSSIVRYDAQYDPPPLMG